MTATATATATVPTTSQAESPAASSPAAAPAASTTPAAAPVTKQTGGFLDHIKTSESSPAVTTQEPTAPAAGTTPETSPATAPAPGETPEPATPEAGKPTQSVVFKTTVRGREYTGEELAKAFELSSNEGLRLNETVKQHISRATAAEAKAAELQAKLDEVPPFKLLTKEEIKELEPAEQVEYALKKNAWETQRDSRKEQLAKTQQAQVAEAQETKNYIFGRTEHMLTNAAEFPGYKDLMPVMEQILDRVPSLAGRRETPDILYYAALGLQKYREGKASTSKEEEARQATAATAKAAAAAAGGGIPKAPVGASNPGDDDSDDAFNKRVLAKATKGFFVQ